MAEGSSRVDLFTALARELIPQGFSANELIRYSRDLGFGIQRAAALGIARETRQQVTEGTLQVPSEVGQITTPPPPDIEWGELRQQEGQWLRYDGPHAIMFQQAEASPNEWLDYVILPEDEDFIGFRMVVEDDEYIDPDRPGSGYRTTQPFPAEVGPAEAARRLGLEQGKVARLIYDRP